MLDLALVMALGFLGSFGHCAGMCGPLVLTFSLSRQDPEKPQPAPQSWSQRIKFQILLTGGRLLSYGLVGALVGSLGSVVVAGGQLAGIGSPLRQGITILTGSLLVGLGLHQINPQWIPDLPLWHPLKQASLHERLHRAMLALSQRQRWWTPACLGMAWGLIPCGFLYTAQIRAAETGSLAQGLATMLAFGLGTAPTMMGVGLSASLLSADRRSQLFRAGGWITLGMGILLVLRTDAMVDLTGYGSLLALMLALVARPMSRLWPTPMRYRRGLGVGSLVLALAHTGHMMAHTLAWNLEGVAFMIPRHQWGLGLGSLAVGLMIPAGLTSFDGAVRALGSRWRQLHLLSLPALGLSVGHCLLTGYRFWTGSQPNGLAVGVLLSLTLAVLLVRWRWVWMLVSQEKWYVAPCRVGSLSASLAPSRDPAAKSGCHPS
ncbi:MAG: sulfite exporter TauE/SafE family protein [Synechococcaceae cyanobacterium SM2_3_2]|nr:sulfite exporter TauE/SafE family protein [Synechococcaceae cyanobacterium SM2_3_2]